MSNPQNTPTSPCQPTAPADVRFEGLPTDGSDPDLEVAEEVSFDLQSDATRRVGAMPAGTPVSKPAEAVAQSLTPDAAEQPASKAAPNDTARLMPRA